MATPAVSGEPITTNTLVPVPTVNPLDTPVVAPVTQPVTQPDVVVNSTGTGIDRINSPATGQHLEATRLDVARNGEKANAPSFFQTVMEIVDFVVRCIPGVGEIANLVSAVIRIGRLAYELISGKEHIAWTKELAHIAGDLVGVIPGFSWAGALANAILNYWLDAQSDERQGAQVMGGVNYLWDGGMQQSSIGYYTRSLFNGVRDMVTTPQPVTAGPTVPAGVVGAPTYTPAPVTYSAADGGIPPAAAPAVVNTNGATPLIDEPAAAPLATTGPQPSASRGYTLY